MKLYDVCFFFTEFQCPTGFDLLNTDKLNTFDNRFQLILRQHLTVFALWSILNCAGDLIGAFILKGNAYYFLMMSGIWGIVNFIVAIGFFYHTIYRKTPKNTIYERLVVQNHVEKMMFLNIGLDVAYVFIGFLLREHSFICNISYTNLWLGFGWAVVMQGLFLLIQDISFLYLYRRNFQNSFCS